MKTITQQLAQYACYHRDKRNIATHLVGIPLIVLGIIALLARVHFATVAGIDITLALVVVVAAGVYYWRLDAAFGVLMTVLLLLGIWATAGIASAPTALWLSWSLGLFVVGWVWQFVGHYFEGRKPAFVDDLMGLVIGPLFVVAEVVFMLGLRRNLRHAVEDEVARLMPDTSSHAPTPQV